MFVLTIHTDVVPRLRHVLYLVWLNVYLVCHKGTGLAQNSDLGS
jgi:hypothetical protein